MSTCNGWSNATSFMGSRCGQPLKTDEQREAGLCGRHLAGKRRRDANKAEHERRVAARDARREAAQALCDQLAEHGISATPDYSFGVGYTGKVILRDAQELLAKLCTQQEHTERIQHHLRGQLLRLADQLT